MRIVFPTERDLFPIERNGAVIADGNAMGIAAKIAKHTLGTGYRLFDIDDPVFPMQRLQKGPECLGIFEWRGRAAETELVFAIRTLESLEKLAAEHLLQNTDWEKETISRSHPMTAIG